MKPTSGYRKPEPGTHPNYFHSAYASSLKRAPTQALISLPETISENTGPVFSRESVAADAFDLTIQHHGQPLGERIAVGGRVLDEDERPVRNALVEIWQANAAGRYLHKMDQHDAPVDPNFSGVGRMFTDEEGRYRFVTIKPGAYPWRNHPNAWRPQHIHFSVFGPAFATRLVTQMYFPGDPLLEFDPIFNSVADEAARRRLVSSFNWAETTPESSLGYRFDIVLRGRNATPVEG
jgi:protocatechuate 3,4-dioxygenase beta subunit